MIPWCQLWPSGFKAQMAYFSMDPHNELVRSHTQQGGLAAIYENGYLSILKGRLAAAH
jgi:cyanophycin synthetase